MTEQTSIPDTADTAPDTAAATVTVKLVRSVAGTRESHRATVRGLGLRRLNSVSTLQDTPAVRGMIDKVSYLVQVL